MKLIDLYDNNRLKYMWSFEYTDKNVVNYVAAIPHFKFIRLVEEIVLKKLNIQRKKINEVPFE